MHHDITSLCRNAARTLFASTFWHAVATASFSATFAQIRRPVCVHAVGMCALCVPCLCTRPRCLTSLLDNVKTSTVRRNIYSKSSSTALCAPVRLFVNDMHTSPTESGLHQGLRSSQIAWTLQKSIKKCHTPMENPHDMQYSNGLGSCCIEFVITGPSKSSEM